jgi:peroxiredoxin
MKLRSPQNGSTDDRLVPFLLAVLLGLGGGVAYFILGARLDSPTPQTSPTAPPTPAVPVFPTGTSAQSMGGVITTGAAALDFQLPDLAGDLHTLAEHQGQVVVLNFWTSWCPPCREEMPALQRAYDRYGEQGLVVLGVNWTQVDERRDVETFVSEIGLTFPILLDEQGQVAEGLYNILGLPTTIFIDRQGIVREVNIGALDLDQLEIKVKSMLEREK